MVKKTVDVNVENHGSIFLFRLNTQAARDWVAEHVPEPMWFGGALACAANYAWDLGQGMLSDGLILE
jgi:hypothetical protein